MECSANRHLTTSDWKVVNFYATVRDQLVNLSPMGLKDGGAWLAPRLEAWEAICRIAAIPEEDRAQLIEMARALHETIEGRLKDPWIFRAPVEWFVPPPMIGASDGR